MADEHDPDELYEESTTADIETWLEDCETAAGVDVSRGGTNFSAWEREFLESIRGQFDKRVRAKPLSGKQLLSLRRCWDKV